MRIVPMAPYASRRVIRGSGRINDPGRTIKGAPEVLGIPADTGAPLAWIVRSSLNGEQLLQAELTEDETVLGLVTF